MAAEILRVGLVGCGEVCEQKHLPALLRVAGARVTALADPDEARARRLASRHEVGAVFSDAASLVRSGAADVIGVLTPPAEHLDAATPALEAGLPLLVEKPVALRLDHADRLVELARHHDATALTGFSMRWHRLVQRAREQLRDGAVGRVEAIHATWSSPRSDRGIPDWKRRRPDGGGAIVELGVHLFDLWRHLLGTEVVEVFARSRHGRRDDESAVVDAVLANGALASARLSERSAHQNEIEVWGSEGRLRVAGQRFDGLETYAIHETDGGTGPRLLAATRFLRELPRGLAQRRRLGDYGDSYRGQWAHLLAAVRCGRPVDCPLEDGREALRVVLAAAESASSGRPVAVASAPASLTPAASAG